MIPRSWRRFLNLFGSLTRTEARKRPLRPSRRKLYLEALEDRTVLSTLPTAVVSNPTTLTGGFSPSIVQDPVNPLKMVEVQTTGGALSAQYSTDGGQTWKGLGTAGNLTDPTTNLPYTVVTNPTVAMDRAENVYITDIERNATLGTAGALVFQRFLFTGNTPTNNGIPAANTNKILQQWVGADPVENPVVAVDNNVPSFTDTTVTPNTTQTDTMATLVTDPTGANANGVGKSLFVAWNTSNKAPAVGAINSNVIMTTASGDGGASFTSPQIVNDSGNGGGVASADPQIVFTQGSADGRVTGGQMVFVWDNIGGGIQLDASQPDAGVATTVVAASQTFKGSTGNFSDAFAQVSSVGVNGGGGNNYTVGQVLNLALGNAVVAPGYSAAKVNVTGINGAAPNAVTSASVNNPTTNAYLVRPTNPVADAGGGGATFNLNYGPDIPVMTTFTNTVNLPAGFNVNDLEVTLDLTDPNDTNLSIDLITPSGTTIHLVRNHIDSSGNTINPNQGITGSNLGEITTGGVTFVPGTVFDDNAPRSIADTSFTSPYIGRFTPEVGKLNQAGITTGVQGTTVNDNGVWQLVVTDVRNDGETTAAAEPKQSVDNWSLHFSTINTTHFGSDHPVGGGVAPVAGAANATTPYPLANTGPYGPAGVGPDISVAVDNTLGAFSPYEGRLYIAYTGGAGTNTDVYLVSGDNLKPTAAPTWNTAVKVNDDSVTDNFSEGNRPQFMPTVAVDPLTGTVGVMYYDGRWDPAVYTGQSRAANSFSDSIDGGRTFSTSTFLNTPKTATDEITGKTVTIEPIPGNQSVANATFGFGDHQALLMYGGNVIPLFSSNANAAGVSILTATVTIAGGPRIIAGDMGPITSSSTFLGTGYNDTFAVDGTQEFTGFEVQFDRPILISSFTPDQVTIVYHDTVTPAALPGVTIPNTEYTVKPIDAGGAFGNLPASSADLLATTFLIQMNPGQERSAVGTYSYAIGNLSGPATINDGIKSASNKNAVSGTGNFVSAVTVTKSGSGYTSAPTVKFSAPTTPGGTTATGTANITNIVNSVTIGNGGGSGYSSAPTVTFSAPPGPGTTATGTAIITGGLVLGSINPTNAGAGYTPNTGYALTFTGGGGAGAAGTFDVTAGGQVTNIQITSAGAGYTSAPAISFNGAGTPTTVATATATLNASVTSIVIINPGSGYTTGLPPTVTLTGGGFTTAASATATITGIVASITINNGGSGYTSAPTVTLTGGGFTTAATATASISSSTGNFMDQNQNGVTGEAPDSFANSAQVDPFSDNSFGYKVGDLLQVLGGTFNTDTMGRARTVELQVTSTFFGSITGLKIVQAGSYSVLPTSPVSVTDLTTNTASGAAIDLTWTNTAGDIFAVPTPTAGPPFQLPYSESTLPLIIPGPHTSSTSVAFNSSASPTATDNLVLNGSNNGIDVNFDRNIDPTTFTAANITRIIGPVGPITTTTLGPVVTFTGGGGTGASGYATLVGGVVTAVTITNQGSGYTSAPTVLFNSQALTSAALLAGGSNYKLNDILNVNGGSFSTQAQLQVTSVGAGGTIQSVAILQAGAYADVALPINPVSVTDVTTPAGSGATFKLSFAGGTLAKGTATITGGKVTAVTVTSGGSGYTGLVAPQAIPDGGTLTVPITISDSLQVNDLSIGLNLTHPQLSDLSVVLTAPDGTKVPLFAGEPGTNLTGTIFDDNATTSLITGSGSFTGIYRPAPGVTGETLVSGGTGYKVGDLLTVVGGTFLTPAQLKVTSIGGGGAITGVSVVQAGAYSVKPPGAVSVTDTTTPAATGATFTLSFSNTLSALNGKNDLGTWTLSITDNVTNGKIGSLNSWSINPVIVTPDPQVLDGTTLSINTAGTGYKINDILTAQGGTVTVPAQLQVTAIAPGVSSAVIAAGGSGYQVGDLLTVQGGTSLTAAQLQVTSIGAGGAITGVSIVQAGAYTIEPLNPVSVTDVTPNATGVNATFKLSYGTTGPITGVALYQAGLYSAPPAVPFSVTGGSGSGATFFGSFNFDGTPGQTFRVTFPTQTISGSYSLLFGQDTAGNYIKDTALNSATIAAGGSGYNVGDLLSVNGGTGTAAEFQVAAVNAGAITEVELVDPGSYTANPTSPVSVTDLTPGATGANAMLNLVFGNRVDQALDAGVPLLFGGTPTGGALNSTPYASGPVNVTLPPGQTVNVPINVSDSYLVQGVTVQLSIQHQNDPDLSATLIAPDGTSVLLFSGVGTAGSSPHANFTNTTFDDSATLPIQLAATQPGGVGIGAGPFNPQLPLSTFDGHGSLGTWTLQITSSSSTLTGKLLNWTLNLKQTVLGGVNTVSDQFTAPFRIFTQDPTNAVSQQSWTAVGPASIQNGADSGRIGGLAVDPSDPSGNTVYTAGASGGVWKTTNFLTTDPNGPTWIPLTDLGPSSSLDMGSIAIVGRNNDPNQSIIFVETGEGDTGTTGVGFLRSMDGGRTWRLLDSTTNVYDTTNDGGNHALDGQVLPINDPGRNHTFVGTTGFQMVVDPKLSPSGQAIIYAALGGANGGIWRSTDSGGHWTLLQAGNASSVALAAGSAGATGNLQILYGAIEGTGVYFTANAPTANAMIQRLGNSGNGIRRDDVSGNAINIFGDNVGPQQGGTGRMLLATPAAVPNNPLANTLYEGWVYAVVNTAAGAFGGLYVSKDFGQNWTKIRLPVSNTNPSPHSTNNDSIAADYSVDGSVKFPQANYDVSLAVDPNNANILYIGGTNDAQPVLNGLNGGGFIRVDTSTIVDPYATVAYDNSNATAGAQVQFATQGAVTLKNPGLAFGLNSNAVGAKNPVSGYFNLLRDPNSPFLTPSTLQFTNIASFGNSGEDARWGQFDGGGLDGTDQHELVTFVDPLTGKTRLIFGDDQGIWTGTDDGTGNPTGGIGTAVSVVGSRNGNLQITQFYDGATQPDTLAADLAGALFYGMAQDDGFPISDNHVLDNGNISWTGGSGEGDGSAVKVDQTGSGSAFFYKWPCCGGSNPLPTDFFTTVPAGGAEVSRTTGLILPGDNPANNVGQWPFLATVYPGDIATSRFALNPIVGASGFNDILISEGGTPGTTPGRVYLTSGPTLGSGITWFPIAEPTDLDSTYAPALAFGAPADANAPPSDFIYVGTEGGHIFVSFTGGGDGLGAKAWTPLSKGLDGNPVQFIVTNPTRGSHEAYAVTTGGVFYMADSSVAGASWVNITGNLFKQPRQLFNDPAQVLDPTAAGQINSTLSTLTSIQADYRYAIPDNLANPNGPTHPVLYVAGNGGVFRSLDKGTTWTFFPDTTIDGAQEEGGFFPSTQVTNLALEVGNINPLTGFPDESSGRDILVATTYGRGDFAIRLNDQITVPGGNPLFTYAVNPVAGPHVASVSGIDDGFGDMTGIQVTFSGPVDPATFTAAKVNSVSDPFGNLLTVASVTPDTSATNHNVYDINFVNFSSALGFYHVSLGPNISDYAGNKMDQNQNGVNGENPADIYSARFLWQPFTNTAPDLTPAGVSAGTVISGGSGYQIGDLLTVNAVAGTFITPAQLQVTSISAGGVITSVLVAQAGAYSVNPSSPVSVTDTTTPTATGATFTLTFGGTSVLPSVNENDTAANIPGTSVNDFVTGLGWPTLGITDADNFSYQATFPPTTAPVGIAITGVDNTHGVWQYSLDNGNTWNAIGAVSDTAALLLEANSNGILSGDRVRFLPNGGFHGTASFTFQAWDLTSGLSVYGADGGTADATINGGSTAFSATSATASITVNFVNHAPTGANNTVTTPEDTPYTFKTTDFGFSDPNDIPPNNLNAVEITTLPALGSLTDNGVAVTAGQFVSAADISGGLLVFTPVAGVFASPYTSFTFQVQDDGGTANGGVDTDPTPKKMTINVTFVNHAPVGTNNTVSTPEDTPYTFKTADFGFSDPNDNPSNSFKAVEITTLPALGSLTDKGVAVTAGQFVPVADISGGKLVFTPVTTFYASPYTSFTFQVQDNGGTASGGVDTDPNPKTMTINVTFVNHAPVGANNTVTTPAGTPYTFQAADFGFTDPNDIPPNHFKAVEITTLPAAGTGTLTDKGNAVTAGQFIPVSDLGGNLVFTPVTTFYASPYATFTFQVQDDGGTANGGVDTDPIPRTMTIDVTPAATQVVVTDNTMTPPTSSGSAAYGQSVTFTATVSAIAPGMGTPVGTVTFTDTTTSTNYTTGIVYSTDASGNLVATLPNITTLAVGTHTITATFAPGNGNFNANTSANTTPDSITIKYLTTMGSVSATGTGTPSNVAYGTPVTLSVTVTKPTGSPPLPTTAPSGVTFTVVNGGTTMNIAATSYVVSGNTVTASVSVSNLAVGTNTISASYVDSADQNFASGNSTPPPAQVTVVGISTTMDPVTPTSGTTNPAYSTDPSFTFKTKVKPATSPANLTGTVTFVVDGSNVAATTFDTTVGSPTFGVATLTLPAGSLAVGPHTIGANFSSDPRYGPSQATTLSETILNGNPEASLSATQPTVFVTTPFSVTVTALDSSNNPTALPSKNPDQASVTLVSGPGTLSGVPAPLPTFNSNGTVTFSTLQVSAAGTYILRFTDAGPGGNKTTTVTFTAAWATTIAVGASAPSVAAGSPVTLGATVTKPAGSPAFQFSGVTFTVVNNNNNTTTTYTDPNIAYNLNTSGGLAAKITLTNLQPGTYTITARYAGTSTLAASPLATPFTLTVSGPEASLKATQPTVTATTPFSVTVTALDSSNNAAVQAVGHQVSVTLVSGPGTLSGVPSPLPTFNSNGTVTFSTLQVSAAGTYTLRFTDTSPGGKTTTVTFNAAPVPTSIAVGASAPSVAAGSPVTLGATVTKPAGSPAFQFSGVTFTVFNGNTTTTYTDPNITYNLNTSGGLAAKITLTNLQPGTYTITARYAGTSTLAASPLATPFTLTVTKPRSG